MGWVECVIAVSFSDEVFWSVVSLPNAVWYSFLLARTFSKVEVVEDLETKLSPTSLRVAATHWMMGTDARNKDDDVAR